MGVYLRILLRYLAGYLVLKGILPQELADLIANDPEISAAIGIVLMGAIEMCWALARKFRWSR